MSQIFDLSQRLYKNVGASSSEQLDYVPANGQKVFMVNMGLSSSQVPDTAACIVWDADGTPELLMTSYSEIVHNNVNITIIGDAVKILRIHLTNDLNEPAYMGGELFI